MEIGLCEWCGKTIYGSRWLMGCRMICEECQIAEEASAEERIEGGIQLEEINANQ